MQDFERFFELFGEVWRDGFAGVDVGRLLTALVILLLFLMLRGLFTRFVMKRLKVLTRRTSNHLDDRVVEALGPPLRMIPLVLGI